MICSARRSFLTEIKIWLVEVSRVVALSHAEETKMLLTPQTRWEGMRRLCVLFLLLLCVMPCLVVFAASSVAEASLPACCRSHGRHKCFLRMRAESMAQSSGGSAIPQVSENCPHNPAFASVSHTSSFGRPAGFSSAVRLDVASCPGVVATERRTPFILRANCERGPPVSSAFARS